MPIEAQATTGVVFWVGFIAAALIGWKVWHPPTDDEARDLIDSAADLIRERPLASFGVAFAAGWIIAKLARSGGGDK